MLAVRARQKRGVSTSVSVSFWRQSHGNKGEEDNCLRCDVRYLYLFLIDPKRLQIPQSRRLQSGKIPRIQLSCYSNNDLKEAMRVIIRAHHAAYYSIRLLLVIQTCLYALSDRALSIFTYDCIHACVAFNCFSCHRHL